MFLTLPVFISALAGSLHAQPVLTSSTSRATAGNFQLQWNASAMEACADCYYILEEARSADFLDARIIYQGTDDATTLSGKSDGSYYYRLARTGPVQPAVYAPAVKVEVQHHLLSHALLYFIAGAIVFGSTLILIFGHREGNA